MKPHYVFRGGKWWLFESRAGYIKYMSAIKTITGYRCDLEPLYNFTFRPEQGYKTAKWVRHIVRLSKIDKR